MNMLPKISILIALGLTACATPAQRHQYETFLGKDIYVYVVVSSADEPADDILKSQACVKRDARCLVMVSAGRELEYATVAVHSDLILQKVFVPRSAAVKHGDIIKIRVAPDPRKVPMFLEFGRRQHDGSSKDCAWVDGSPLLRTGGVACNGWNYKSLELGAR